MSLALNRRNHNRIARLIDSSNWRFGIRVVVKVEFACYRRVEHNTIGNRNAVRVRTQKVEPASSRLANHEYAKRIRSRE